ncbi:hypothetical protein M0802_016874 [Mischocyttarus mexicanus]|nr:hypothetical protein M0802_016874 [Mischocyttarus mexicanus]
MDYAALDIRGQSTSKRKLTIIFNFFNIRSRRGRV